MYVFLLTSISFPKYPFVVYIGPTIYSQIDCIHIPTYRENLPQYFFSTDHYFAKRYEKRKLNSYNKSIRCFFLFVCSAFYQPRFNFTSLVFHLCAGEHRALNEVQGDFLCSKRFYPSLLLPGLELASAQHEGAVPGPLPSHVLYQ